ncbi:hypothetical protein [Peribacillus muralis]|uniref:hypothetical protein n=1 Tax=Peribacillus muralis TaxID=264697 RepID=UPI00366F5C9E
MLAVKGTDQVKLFQISGLWNSNLVFYKEWNGTEGARLLREMRVYVRPHRLKAEEAQGPPAERERLQWKETGQVQLF